MQNKRPLNISAHKVPVEHFRSVAAGGGSPDALRLLMNGERSRRLLLLHLMMGRAVENKSSHGPLPSIEFARDRLIALEERSPAIFDHVLMQPQTGMWIAHCLRRLNGAAWNETPLWVDIGYIFNFIIAVAARAGIEFSVPIPHRGGQAMLPTVGLARLPLSEDFGLVRTHVEINRIRLESHRETFNIRLPTAPDTDYWLSMRSVRLSGRGGQVEFWLDDLDPYRQIGTPVNPDRLTRAEFQRWHRLFDEACDILDETSPPAIAAMTLGLLSVVPLPPAPNAIGSASSGDSFGSVLITRPSDPEALAVALVHEFQHVKLGGLMHLASLHTADDTQRFYAPWRDDPRPLSGLLQGVYAFFGVTEFWRKRRRSSECTMPPMLAEFEFALWRERTWRSLQDLKLEQSMNSLGRRFIAALEGSMASWWEEQTDPRIVAAAKLAVEDHRIRWRISYLLPNPGDVAKLVHEFNAAHPLSTDTMQSPRIIAQSADPWPHRRFALIRLSIADPEAFSELLDENSAETDQYIADLALVSGQYIEAAQRYVKILAENPEETDAWTGLLLAVSAEADQNRPLAAQPELLPAMYRRLIPDHTPGKVDMITRLIDSFKLVA